jgi:hypothetical protein
MPGPFPGMDPYLEHPAHWGEFHSRFITYCCDALADVLPDNYSAHINERVSLAEGPPLSQRRIGPDVALERRQGPPHAPGAATSTLQAPVTLPLPPLEDQIETFIRILHRPDRSLVGVLELLSPTNKEGVGYGAYLSKRNAVLRQSVHLIEIDLLRGGQRLPLRLDPPPADYYAYVARADCRPDCQVWFWDLPQPLPPLSIPLRAPDPDVTLDLAAVVITAYERARFGREIDYAQPPPLPVAPEQQAWLEERLRTVRPA